MEDIRSFPFNPGDELLFIGYANGLQSGMTDIPEGDKTYTFQFAENIPCPGMPAVEYEGQIYNTIQILGHCWLKENLNVGTMISGTMGQSNNGIIEKYCYNNDLKICDIFGGLYQWDEAMQYTLQNRAQGICPPGWYIPSDEDRKVLEGAVDSLYGIGGPHWDSGIDRGYDAGRNLKTTDGWYFNNGTDLYGFAGMPAGRALSGIFANINLYAYWWSSSAYIYNNYDAWYRYIYYSNANVGRRNIGKAYGFSVRCIKEP